jgi:hypothetical protein
MRRYAGGKGVTKVLHGGVSCFAGTRHPASRRTNVGDVMLQQKWQAGASHVHLNSASTSDAEGLSSAYYPCALDETTSASSTVLGLPAVTVSRPARLVVCLGLFSHPPSAASLACCTWLISLAARPHQDHPHQDRPAGNIRFGPVEPCNSQSSESSIMNEYKSIAPADYYPQPPYH